jgi:hypothetical protein
MNNIARALHAVNENVHFREVTVLAADRRAIRSTGAEQNGDRGRKRSIYACEK